MMLLENIRMISNRSILRRLRNSVLSSNLNLLSSNSIRSLRRQFLVLYIRNRGRLILKICPDARLRLSDLLVQGIASGDGIDI